MSGILSEFLVKCNSIHFQMSLKIARLIFYEVFFWKFPQQLHLSLDIHYDEYVQVFFRKFSSMIG